LMSSLPTRSSLQHGNSPRRMNLSHWCSTACRARVSNRFWRSRRLPSYLSERCSPHRNWCKSGVIMASGHQICARLETFATSGAGLLIAVNSSSILHNSRKTARRCVRSATEQRSNPQMRPKNARDVFVDWMMRTRRRSTDYLGTPPQRNSKLRDAFNG